MELGITMLTTWRSLAPARLAVEVESRGFESLWVPEHSHIPASRLTPFPGAAPGREELPDVYWNLNDQLVSMAMAAAATDRLVLGSAVTLVAQHDPIWLAKQLATLDHHSGGRIELGVGFGWNREEYEAHGHRWDQRHARTRDAIGLMRALWSEEDAVYAGETMTLDASWAWPKPTRPIPVVLGGGAGPRLRRHLVDWADGWMPIRTPARPLAEDLDAIRAHAADAGRDPASIRVTVMNAPRNTDELDELRELGVERAVFTIWPQEPDAVLRALDDHAEVAATLR